MKISFNQIKKYDILILDKGLSNLTFEDKKFKEVNLEEINFFCVLKSLINYFKKENKLFNLKKIYKKTLYKAYSPKVVISNFISQKGQECKILCPEIKVILYQFTYFNHDIIKPMIFFFNKYKTFEELYDYFLVFSEKDIKFLEKYNIKKKENVIVSGSIKNNARKEIGNFKKIHNLTYISQYIHNSDDYYAEGHFKGEKFIINALSEYCRQKNLSLTIALRGARKDKKYDAAFKKSEINYYKNLTQYQKIYFSDEDSLKLAMQSELIICFYSNLGLELISRGYKVLFLPVNEVFGGAKYYHLPERDNSVTERELKQESIIKKIEFLYNLDQADWKDHMNLNDLKLIQFDPENKILKNIVKKLIK